MKLVLLSIETSKQPWFSEFSGLYEKKISHFVPFEIHRLKSRAQSRDAQDRKIKEESEQILKFLKEGDLVVVCDERGRSFDAQGFAKKMISGLESGKKRMVFVIGGAYGCALDVKARAEWTWCLAPMTMNHFVAQTVATEQIYRALTIWKGVPYHNE